VAQRLEGVRALSAEGVPVVLRIDPLLPRSPLPPQDNCKMEDFGLVEAQTLEDMEKSANNPTGSGAKGRRVAPAGCHKPLH